MADVLSITTNVLFDKARVIDAMDKKVSRCLYRTGAFARTIMRRGMRKRKATSAIGDYPSSHDGHLKNLVKFAVNERDKSVIIGPELYPGSKDRAQRSQTIPELINQGGSTIVTRKGGKRIRRSYLPRPFVALTQPKAVDALRQNMEKIPLK